MAGFANLIWLDLECSDPPVLAEFYHQLLGWNVTHGHDEYAVLSGGSIHIRFGRLNGYGPGLARLGRAKALPPGLAGGRCGESG